MIPEIQNTNRFGGVIVYTIGRNGCLNGFYTNDAPPRAGEVFNEIAKKTDTGLPNSNEHGLAWNIIGDYITSWIEVDSNNRLAILSGVLSITPNGDIFNLVWSVQSQTLFAGTGFLTGDNQLTVRYQPV